MAYETRVRATITTDYVVNPGGEGYPNCITVGDCAVYDQKEYDDGNIDMDDLLEYGKTTVKFHTVVVDTEEEAADNATTKE